MKNPLHLAAARGQSIWLDALDHRLVSGGELQRLIGADGLSGLTSNPSILEQAIARTDEYRDLLEAPESRGLDAKAMYERLAARDLRDAADILRPVFHDTQRRDGYVSWEVSPHLAHDTEGTLAEARRLWAMVDRENLMIKVPATREGIPALRQLVGEGLNVNVTLLFAADVYEQAASAYLDGLDDLLRQGGDPTRVASVASFFVSRIDTAVDQCIGRRIEASRDPEEQAGLRSLLGRVACASARIAYQRYLALVRGQRWQDLSRLGARSQRLLWASTANRNPDRPDARYVEELIGPDTVTTLPPGTLDAFRDHGRVRDSLTEDPAEATRVMQLVLDAGIPLQDITDQLLTDGLRQFAAAFDRLLRGTRRDVRVPAGDPIEHLRIRLFKELYTGRWSP